MKVLMEKGIEVITEVTLRLVGCEMEERKKVE